MRQLLHGLRNLRNYLDDVLGHTADWYDDGDGFLFSFAVNVNEQRIIAFLTEKCCYLNL